MHWMNSGTILNYLGYLLGEGEGEGEGEKNGILQPYPYIHKQVHRWVSSKFINYILTTKYYYLATSNSVRTRLPSQV